MKPLLVLGLLLSASLVAAPPAAADHWTCAPDPLTEGPCLVAAAVLNCVTHRLEGRPCSLP